MTITRTGALRVPLLGAALLALAGCAAPDPTDWNLVSVRDQHRHMPTVLQGERPTVIITAGPTGMVVGTGPELPAPAVQVVAQEGQLRLVSQETLATLNAQPPTSSMGASPAPAPAR
jgi:type IV pilus biogenesis protein CpaD/CtpE